MQITADCLAAIRFELFWRSHHVAHTDAMYAPNVNFQGDILPLNLKSRLLALGPGDGVEMQLDASEVPQFSESRIHDMPLYKFRSAIVDGRRIKPRIGRYYPQTLLQDVPGAHPSNTLPFRVVGRTKASLKADLNHPMAGREVTLRARVLEVRERGSEPGGMLHNWTNVLLDGPGMQARLEDTPTDFLGSDPFHREDESPDAEFFSKPRLVPHLDRQARENIVWLYDRLLADGMDVLDLMAGHISHLPDALRPGSVTGLGMNQEEMRRNSRLDRNVVHDLNADPTLPFADNSFDALVCTSSVEYLIQPFEVFADAARVLRPGGVFVLTFSHRWFQPKVIRIWAELHEFERMGLVCQYFKRSGAYRDLETWSERGWPRPFDERDRYYPALQDSDPVFAVWGRVGE
ncbi:methyltransferase domain-containing protein [Pseudodesulfovibrio tunisiensis]|uniref:methyltransferase domain-containing protein n=1 Tax=Pseudodesulfovibrio tunisiensis TaxID=463192 RepID=UPI001FB49990|nr:methyltransferase domain-containing protein [Pseudodesulfovibrio tunisiensis]